MPKQTLKQFKEAHPHCCFCGGEAETETRDEVPPKTVFFKRQWPETYQFPACFACNQSSRQIDLALGLISRMSVADVHSHEEDLLPHIRGVTNNRPDLLPTYARGSIEAKKLLRQLRIKKPSGMFAQDVPIVLLPASTINQLDVFFGKLFCALYYKHVGRIVPRASNVVIAKTTNQILDDENPYDWQIIPAKTHQPEIKRAGKSLQQQFDYNWTYNSEEDLFGFNFHVRYSLFGLVFGPVSDSFVSDFPDDMKLKTGPQSA